MDSSGLRYPYSGVSTRIKLGKRLTGADQSAGLRQPPLVLCHTSRLAPAMRMFVVCSSGGYSIS